MSHTTKLVLNLRNANPYLLESIAFAIDWLLLLLRLEVKLHIIFIINSNPPFRNCFNFYRNSSMRMSGSYLYMHRHIHYNWVMATTVRDSKTV